MYKPSLVVAFIMLGTLVSCNPQITEPEGTSFVAHESASHPSVLEKKGPPSTATIWVGRNDLGTDFFPPGSHDGSFHAKDALQPRTVVISAGGTVTFQQSVFHAVAIYDDGTKPEDIDVTQLDFDVLPFEFPPVINDPEGRIFRSEVAFPAPKEVTFTFETPGDYLVICEVLPHFAEAKMYGYVRVK